MLFGSVAESDFNMIKDQIFIYHIYIYLFI